MFLFSESVCTIHDSARQTQSQCHTLRSWDSAAGDLAVLQTVFMFLLKFVSGISMPISLLWNYAIHVQTDPLSAVGNVSGNRCESDFRGDWS